jgi:hypothetical protein
MNKLQKKNILRMCFYFVGWLYKPLTIFLVIGGTFLNIIAYLDIAGSYMSVFMGFVGFNCVLGGMLFRDWLKGLYETHICGDDFIRPSDVMYDFLDEFEHDCDPNYYSNLASWGILALIVFNIIAFIIKVISIRGM